MVRTLQKATVIEDTGEISVLVVKLHVNRVLANQYRVTKNESLIYVGSSLRDALAVFNKEQLNDSGTC